MKSITAIVCGRNDNYAFNLNQRASYCLNSLISIMDEVIFIDYNTINNITLVEAIRNNLTSSNKLRVISIPPEEVKILNRGERDPQVVSETFSKNIGIRRATSEWVLSTSIEDIPSSRKTLEEILINKDIFYIGAKRRIPLSIVESLGNYKEYIIDKLELLKEQFPPVGPSGAYPGDVWSKINSCGDFQFAHKDLWFKLKAFEENLTGRGFLDTNIQKKAMLMGHEVRVTPELNGFHIEHPPHSFGGFGKINDINKSIKDFQLPSQNNETWGFSNFTFKEFNLMDII
jgi:hypothetical protein